MGIHTVVQQRCCQSGALLSAVLRADHSADDIERLIGAIRRLRVAGRGMSSPPVIDAHSHSGVGGAFTAPGEPDASLARHARRAVEAGIDRTVLMAPPVGEYREANQGVGAIVTARPHRHLGLAAVNPVAQRARVAAR